MEKSCFRVASLTVGGRGVKSRFKVKPLSPLRFVIGTLWQLAALVTTPSSAAACSSVSPAVRIALLASAQRGVSIAPFLNKTSASWFALNSVAVNALLSDLTLQSVILAAVWEGTQTKFSLNSLRDVPVISCIFQILALGRFAPVADPGLALAAFSNAIQSESMRGGGQFFLT